MANMGFGKMCLAGGELSKVINWAFVLLVGAFLFFLWGISKPDPNREIDSLLSSYENAPSPEKLRRLISCRADGAYGYKHMAATGRAFARSPEIFHEVSSQALPDHEGHAIRLS